jgi:type IV pilus biogenesis protein CpaD/CtpE
MWRHAARLLTVPTASSVVAVAVVLGMAAHAQTPASEPAGSPQLEPQEPIFRSGVTLVTTDVIVRDADGQFDTADAPGAGGDHLAGQTHRG